MKLGFQTRLFLSLVTLLGSLLLVVLVTLDWSLPAYLESNTLHELTRMAQIAGVAHDEAKPEVGHDDLAGKLGRETGLRITLISPDGTVISDSDVLTNRLSELQNHRGRPEVEAAVRTGLGHDVRRSETLGVEMMYVATRRLDGSILRVAMPLVQIQATKSLVTRSVAMACGAVALVAIPLSFLIARQISRPIEAMRNVATRAAEGDLTMTAPEAGGPELAQLGQALNRMSQQLDLRLQELQAETAELQAILSTMADGVLVVDHATRVQLVNAALTTAFGINSTATGQTAMEAFRHHALAELIEQTLATGCIAGKELVFFGQEDRAFDVTVAPLRNGASEPKGAVVVFHDISRLRQLEQTRRDFVANASHELRTPLAVIRGYVETLREQPGPDPDTAATFLATIDRNARRLEALLGDLLMIAELESQQAHIRHESVQLAEIAAEASKDLESICSARDSRLTLSFPADLPAANGDAARLHQVFSNLMENALKYSPVGSEVRVTARAVPEGVEVCVADNGPGIPSEHLGRIFERFYRVDKARSREMGGTGLGLSIVKHIVQAHGGRVWAESRMGHGSSFFFIIPGRSPQ